MFFCANFFYTQVGINTNDPKRTLHINGNLKVSDLKDASDDADFDRILVADQKGNVDYVVKQDFLPASGTVGFSNKETYSTVYNQTTGTGNEAKELKCGKFVFIFDKSTDSNIKFYLQSKPESTVSIYMNMEQNWSGNGFQFYQGTTPNNTLPFVFTTTNYNTAQLFASANVADYEQNVMHFQYPGDNNFYRLIIYRVKHSNTSYDFVAACEKF